MRRFRIRGLPIVVLVIFVCFAIVSMARRQFEVQVFVTDEAGNPVAGAGIVLTSLSTASNPYETDASGMATLPRYPGSQEFKWITISASGYQSVQLEAPTNWPLRVALPSDSQQQER